MVHIICAGFLVVFSIHYFTVNYNLSKVNAAYLGLYKGVAEDAVVLSDESGNEVTKPYFDKTVLMNNVKSYFDKEIGDWCSYSVKYAFGPVVKTPENASVVVTFKVPGWKDYTRTARFAIVEGYRNG